MNNKKVKITILIILVLIIMGISTYLIFKNKSLMPPKENNSNNEETNQEIIENDNNEEFNENENIDNTQVNYNFEYLDKIINNSLNSLLNKNKLEELTNQERLIYLINLYEGDKYSKPIKISDLEKIHSNSIIKNLEITYTDVYDYYNAFSPDKLEQEKRQVGYEYNKEDNTLKYTGALGHGHSTVSKIMHKELIDYKKQDNEYIIKYKFVFASAKGSPMYPLDLYYKSIDAYNQENSFKNFNFEDCVRECTDYETPAKIYIKENYDNIKGNLPIYTYKFKVEDNNLVIIDFSVDKTNDEEINIKNKTKVDEIIDNELKQLLNKEKLSDLTNQDKLQTILKLYTKENGYTDNIKKETLDNIFKNSSLRNLGIEYTDIYAEKKFKDTDDKLYKLTNDTYKKEERAGNETGVIVNMVDKKLVDYKENKEEIIISYKYLFDRNDGGAPKFYNTIEDALNDKNIILTSDPFDFINEKNPTKDQIQTAYEAAYEYAKSEFDRKYLSQGEMKQAIYTYKFKIENNNLILTDFYTR